MIESPANGRARIVKTGNCIDILVPTKKNWFLIIFLTLWMCGWVMGEAFAIRQLFVGETPMLANAFLLFWLLLWTVGGGFVMMVLLWSVAGQEILKIEDGVIEIGKQVFNVKRSKKYHTKDIRHFSINLAWDNNVWGIMSQRNFFGLMGGVLKFDYGLKTVKFGSGIDEAEGRLLIELFKANQNFKEGNFG